MLSDYHVAALDLRSHGESEWNVAYSPDDYLNDVDRLIDALNVSMCRRSRSRDTRWVA
jgi:pimeloyl-ACP methyl ester carboxylesterase